MSETLYTIAKKQCRRRLCTGYLVLLLIFFVVRSGPAATEDTLDARASSQSTTLSRFDNPEIQDPGDSSSGLSLEQCLEIALANNPLLLANYDQYQAALARVNIARSFPQPEILLDYPLQPKFFSPGQSEETFFWVNQSLEFPGRRSLRTRAASLEASETYQDNESLKLSIAYQVKEAFFGLLLIEEQLRFARENLQLNMDFTDMVEVKHSSGEVSRAEVLRARVELAKAEALVKRFETEREIMAARLNVLLGRDKNGGINVSGELRQPLISISLAEAKEVALSLRPEIKKMEYSLSRIFVQKKQAYLSYLPDFNLGFARHRVEGIKYWDFSLSFSVPLFFWQVKRGQVAEVEALARSREKEILYWKDLVSLEVEEAYRQVIYSQEQIRLFEENILAQAEQVYQMFLFSFKEGQIGGLDLIEARRTWNESRTTYAEHLYQHAVSLAALGRAMGKIQ